MTVPGKPAICPRCVHFHGSHKLGWTCHAFPEEIPDEITNMEFDHHEPHPGDNGIQFEEAPEE